MNATLQCLRNTLYLANYFLNPKNEKFITLPDNKLSISFLEVIKKLWIKKYNDDKNNYSPYNFKKIISEMNPLFEGVEANDSKDLINFILQQLHSELNLTKNNDNTIINNINQYDKLAMIQNFLIDFQQNNHSIISDCFFGIIETETVCLNCKERYLMNGIVNPPSLYNFQFISFIIFPLEEIRKMKSNTNNINCNEVNIYDCFDYYERPELLKGDNAILCQNCQQVSPAYYMTKIYSSPYYFILILNRGKGNLYDVKLYFEEEIDIGKYVEAKKKNNLFYKLYAIVTHLGPSSMSGHFIAFCRSPIDNNWYEYNDDTVHLIGNFYKDIHEFGCPYILFYERNEK
jgi:ubiquitin C-terminal hydrolase